MPGILLSPSGCCCDPPGCKICVHVQDACDGTPRSGATVTIRQGTTVIGTCTTDANGGCCLSVAGTGSGTYNASVSESSRSGSNKDVSITCDETKNVTLTTSSAAKTHTFCVRGCNSFGLSGATVTIGGGTYTVGSDGCVDISLPAGTYPYVMSRTRYASYSGSVDLTCGGGSFVQQTLNPATGYRCHCSIPDGTCDDPIPDTLTLTDSKTGTCVLTWNGTVWQGSISGYAFPGYCTCPAKTVTTITYRLAPFALGCTLSVEYTVNAVTGCPENVPSALYGPVGMTTVSCAPAFMATGTIGPCVCPCGLTPALRLWGATGGTVTITE